MELREYWTPTRPLLRRHPQHRSYPLLPGDLLVFLEEDQEWAKVAPGLHVQGFTIDVLADDLQAVRVYWTDNLTYFYADSVPADVVAAHFGFLPPPPEGVPQDVNGNEVPGEWEWDRDNKRWIYRADFAAPEPKGILPLPPEGEA